jgi:hypothetical protein
LGELATQMLVDVMQIKVLEGAIVGCVEEDQDGHDLAEMHPALAMPVPFAIRQQMPFPLGFKHDSKLVQIIKQCDDIHWRPPCRQNLVFLTETKALRCREPPFESIGLRRTDVF